MKSRPFGDVRFTRAIFVCRIGGSPKIPWKWLAKKELSEISMTLVRGSSLLFKEIKSKKKKNRKEAPLLLNGIAFHCIIINAAEAKEPLVSSLQSWRE